MECRCLRWRADVLQVRHLRVICATSARHLLGVAAAAGLRADAADGGDPEQMAQMPRKWRRCRADAASERHLRFDVRRRQSNRHKQRLSSWHGSWLRLGRYLIALDLLTFALEASLANRVA